MKQLTELQCEACREGAPRVDGDEAAGLLTTLPDWQLMEVDGIDQLQRVYKFRNFKLAWAFADKVAELAEAEGHHPAILLEWGSCTVTWWTHKIKGLHKNDFICAAKTDVLFED
ncbi:4a-hydroxytetrahydrobiopterin dehydratase [Grimontia hollisae]|uniref:Putative pterin-4-alpha-carbinolamine dehydratase n=1 Tax=Grimontia hollisae CIP 101886 TaxID=675812 RepID=D0I5S8_GRIHO|nr:4a-hydroxytetrahydrobiopterin dehydratase [Grimontia hollisae]AMG29152.1 4a-hydroxytetrahydrobiopterin dehydratase [Grimontia hollisae]EEY73242.1 pterin-4-alpha-carbinolamine dehydratase [Grimontia hollisae CIP 101886]MDF2184982.1 4a-hydroxytetrahydrobiopterin dehydratase [Grimontia hollisae]STO76789.1 Putative pterin-4-alpha-carbinolamine dehydratase [Grimontia hollisae]STQ76056.1 Putative pterin-4-alpha-carbinolamine dehydratase [Grimontia hollisae]